MARKRRRSPNSKKAKRAVVAKLLKMLKMAGIKLAKARDAISALFTQRRVAVVSLCLNTIILVKLFQIEKFLNEALTAIYVNAFFNSMIQMEYLDTILKAVKVFLKDA